ncbi:MAG: flagellar basal body P-ring protein FlgI [Phycisphaerales bacterium]|nr:flagellar basal body P-ring protein FlgI [Phycisphaerales bacterium]
MTRIAAFITLLLFTSLAVPARAISVQELAHLEGEGESELWGYGLVTGLPGTGDSTEFLPMARQLAQLMENGGNPVPDLAELEGGRSVAMVMVTCRTPRQGMRKGDAFDCFVTTMHNAKSLRGGRLFLTPMLGPTRGAGVYAFARGDITIEGPVETSGRVRDGASVVVDHRPATIKADGTVRLVVEPEYANWTTTRLLANTINDDQAGIDDSLTNIARAIDERTVVITIPRANVPNPAQFIAHVLSINIDQSLLELPARVIVNERLGTIAMSADVEISPVAVTTSGLQVTILRPEIPASPDAPRRVDRQWVGLNTVNEERQAARLEDLLRAMEALDVPIRDRIAVLQQIHDIGHLHAELIFE